MDLVLDFLNNKIKLTKYDSVVVGVSAGPDSMCLLYLLLELRKKIGFKIIVAHINHNIRKESEEEQQFLHDYTIKHDVIFESMKIQNYKHDNFHKVAREIRYNFYVDLVNKYHATYLMTAHHGDDLIETVLMRLVRGSTLEGYHGISLITKMPNYYLVRPLLFLTKDDIKIFNDTNNIPYRIDVSNFSSKYTRNRYRKEVLPFLKEENPNVHLKFLKFSNMLDDANNYIEKVLDDAYNNTYRNNTLNIIAFKEYDQFIQKLLLEKVLKDVYDDLSKITNKHIELILNLIIKSKSGSRLNLPDSIICCIDYDYLKFQKQDNSACHYCLELVDGLVIPNGMQFITLDNLENGNDTLHLKSSDVKLPLYVRNKRDGDYIEMKGMNGKRKVSDIFIDKKISKFERLTYPVVVDSNDTIVWIPKLKKSKYDSQNDKKCDIMFKCL